ncbi:CPBP family intramembrane glutamic endopeptidase [Pasteuria penetrans]|uniref:CPBP family intramembrane glutamic endopeptidase n=1 Tax=Pasteuria penetrans TaxID=86005 RepID=UPI001CAA75E7|nr:CPBP family intramembrane glutamic endopeptidase [Pasteuria penetrans]
MSLVAAAFVTSLVFYSTISLFVKFDHAYYQHTVVIERSPRQRLWQNCGKVVDVLFASFYFISIGIALLFQSPFFDGGIIEVACNVFSLLIYLFMGIFFLLPSVRDPVMTTLGLNAQRYLHRFLIVGIAYCIVVLVGMFPEIPLQGYDFLWNGYFHRPIVIEGVDGLAVPSVGVISYIPFINFLFFTLWALLGAGWTTTRTWRETIVRLGFHKKLTMKDWSIVTGLTISFLGIWFLGDALLSSSSMQKAFDISLPVAIPLAFLLILLPALGEELLYRGAIQPRLGIVWTSVISTIGSTILEPVSPSWQIVFWIFLSSLGLGWLANRYNLQASLWAHILLKAYIVLYIMKWV